MAQRPIQSAMAALSMALALAGSGAWAETFSVACDPYPPFADPEAPGKGIAIQIAEAALAAEGHSIRLSIVPWARAEAGAMGSSYDLLANTWKTASREQSMAFSTPYANTVIRFIKRKGDPFEYAGLSSLAGKKIGTIRGYGYGDAFMEETFFTKEPNIDLLANIKKLLLGRLDLTLEDEAVSIATLSSKPELAQEIEFSSTPLSIKPLHLAASKANPKGLRAIEAFDKGFETIRRNGTLRKILASKNMEQTQNR